MDIKTVMRAASQRLGLVKQADTNNYYRPWGFNPDGSVRRPAGQAPAMQKTPPQPRAFGGQVVPTHSATAYGDRSTMANIHALTNAQNARIQDLTGRAETEEANSRLGLDASVRRGRIYQKNYTPRAVNTMDSVAAANSARQFASAPKVTQKWWNPRTWDAKGTAGANAGTNVGVEATSSRLANNAKTMTPEERAAEERRVRAMNWRLRQGTAINLMKPTKWWQSNKRDIGDMYVPEAWGTHVADMSQSSPQYAIDKKTNADTRTKDPAAYDPWKKDEDGNVYRDITSRDIKYDREMRAKHLMNAFYGADSYNGNEEALYNDMLEKMSQMRNSPEYYKNGVWTSGALDFWRGNDNFQRAYNNISRGRNYDQNAVLNAFLANANNMYWDNTPYTPKPTGI